MKNKCFRGECPYTGRICKVWLCRFCRIEHRERKYAKSGYKRKEVTSELDMALEGIRRIHESVMAEFKPNFSIFDGLTEEEMWLMFFILNQMRKEADNEQ